NLDIGARKGAWPQILIRRQDNTHGALSRAGIDDRANLPDRAGEALGHTVQSHRGTLPERQSWHILLGHLPAHLNPGIAREVKQHRGARYGNLTHFSAAREHDT